ncbi:retroviral-like aspartic protease family protein [Alteromonas sp. 1_MG-2023]|uniref:aspartyl protease family protein n=1 Tax=Alteromonas sp. 1_MG-2023 TaxID=3062669 RepID=UPI0026E33CFC|nr:retroviral-like aspartic protease family protein [Alteromonas sp. 1_MG-2023]MDO6567502.1 retroviral-like aspartic protease family protein [Alteromonas sp. 1_MG-2023]
MKSIILFTLLLINAPFAQSAMDEIPLHVTDDGHFSLEAVINGREGRFILDTGSTGTIVGLSKLEYFGIRKAKSTIDGIVVGDEEKGKIETFPISIESLVIGTHKLTIKNIHSNSTLHLGSEIDGIIGHDAIVELRAMVDIKNSKLLVPEKGIDVKALFTGSDSKYTAIPLLQTEMGFTLVKARLEQHDVVMLVDSGAQQVVLDMSVVADDFGFDLENHPKAKLVGRDGTETPMKVILNKTIKIGNAAIDGDFLVADFGALKQSIGSKNGTFMGIIGNKELASINSIIDAANGIIYVHKT